MFILFDLDGTLIDHKYAEKNALSLIYTDFCLNNHCEYEKLYSLWKVISKTQYNLYLEKVLTFDEHYYERFRLLMESISKYSCTEVDIMKMVISYRKSYLDNIRVYDDVQSCLNSLHNFKKGIITNGDTIEQYAKLEKCNLLGNFEFVIISDGFEKAKPDLSMFIKAIELSGLKSNKLFMIGDNYCNDVLPCSALGISAALLNRESLEQSNEIISFSNLIEFTHFILNCHFN